MRTKTNLFDMRGLLVVVDMQNDFVTGALGSEAAQAIVPDTAKFIECFDGQRIFTMDTHDAKTYLETQEGKNLPVPHTIKGTWGWELVPEIKSLLRPDDILMEKPAFGSDQLGEYVKSHNYKNIYVLGLDTGYCVISNVVVMKTFAPESVIHVLADLCACATPESHETALTAMDTLHVDIITKP